MTDKELRELSRKELLELLIEQSKEIEKLRAELEESRKQLEEKEIKIAKAGSIAEASLVLNGVFEAAQSAAEQYLANIRNTDDVCKSMRTQAEQDAQRIMSEARTRAEATVAEAKTNADKYWHEVSQKLERFYNAHQGLKELLNVSGVINKQNDDGRNAE